MRNFTENLVACIDESGKLADTEVVALSGCLANQEKWETFDELWCRLLLAERIPHLSMKDAIHFHGPFKNWCLDDPNRTARRDALLTNLAKLIGQYTSRVSSPMIAATFKALPAQQREKLGNDIHYCGFETCLRSAMEVYPNASFSIICDLSEEYATKCLKLFNKLRRQNAEAKVRLFGISFLDDTRRAGLQAADMVAYCSRANATRSSRRIEPVVDSLYSILFTKTANTKTLLYRAGGEGLGHGEFEKRQT